MKSIDSRVKTPVQKTLAVLSALIIALMALPFYAYADVPEVVTVKVGYYENEVFQEGAREGAIKTGYAYEYYRKISEYTGWKYEYVYGDFGELYKKLEAGEIDLLAGLAKKEGREKVISYPTLPMGNESYNLVRHSSDDDVSADPSTLNGKKIGVLDSAMVDVLNEYLSTHGVTAEVEAFSDYTKLFEAFDSGRLDVMAAEGDGAYGRDKAEVLLPFGASDYYLCVSKDREDLLKTLNAAQSSLISEEPNYVYSLKTKYYPVSITARAFSAVEKEWLRSHDELKIGYLDNYLPYSGTDENGEVNGIVKDIIPKILEGLGTSDIKVSYSGYESYDSMIDDMSEGVIDLAFPVGGGLYYSEENGLYQSLPVASTSTELVHTGTFSDDTLKLFAVNENNRMQYYYVRTHFPDAEILMCPSIEDCLEAVMSGKASCTTLNGLRANDILKNTRYKDLVMHQLARNDDRCFGVEIGNEGLLKLLNRGINVVGSDYAQSISFRYTNELYTYSFADAIMDHLLGFMLVVSGVVALIMYLLIRDGNRTKKQMEEKEAAASVLEEKNKELQESQQRLAETDEIVGDAGFGIWKIFIEEGKQPRMRGNAKMMELLGLSGKDITEEEVYADWYSRIVPEDEASVQKSVGEMLSGKPSENTYRWVHPDLGMLYVRCGGTAKKIAEGFHVLKGYHSDVTNIVKEDQAHKEALQKALTEAERANQAKTTFLNNMSHDIRTPMNAIVGFTTLASTHLDDREKVEDYLKRIDISSKHLLSLINDVLDMSRIESGNMTLEESEVHLPDVIKDIETIIRSTASAKNLDLSIDMQGVEHEDIVTDKLRLNQVLMNLLSNAIKFTPEGGSVSVRVSEEDTAEKDVYMYEFRVKDTGIGMSPEFKETIFESFTREHTSTVSGIQGTGLGMAITKSIVDMMGGTIVVNSEEGKGTEFIVKVPCRAVSRSSVKETAVKHESRSFAGKRVLLAEDNEMNQIIAETILTEAGLLVEIAADGQIAVDKVKSADAGYYDIILMDIQMPKMNGYEAAKLIRELPDPAKANIPIVAVTANAFEEDRRIAMEAGMKGHLAKPYDIPKMMETLEELL